MKIVRDAGIDAEDCVLEIGAGLGSLTRVLAVNARRVIAVELDPSLFSALENVIRPFNNIQLIQGDILEIPLEDLVEGHYQVVANIPYYLSLIHIYREPGFLQDS